MAASVCGVTTLHQPLFDCDNLYPTNTSDSTGPCNALFSSGIRSSFSYLLMITLIVITFFN